MIFGFGWLSFPPKKKNYDVTGRSRKHAGNGRKIKVIFANELQITPCFDLFFPSLSFSKCLKLYLLAIVSRKKDRVAELIMAKFVSYCTLG